jgi:hypothetical protein
MNEKTIQIDRETKVLMLNALKRGYFDKEDVIYLNKKIGGIQFPTVINIIEDNGKHKK